MSSQLRLLSACCALLAGSALAQRQQNHIQGKKLAEPPTIDGVIGEADEWKGVPTLTDAFDIVTGERSAEPVTYWIAYDQDFIYFAARMHDSQPATIKATEYRTNVSLSGDDSVALRLDLSGSLADFNEFAINPKGATDIQLAGGRAAKREWSGEFVAKGRITSDGWECEAKIPWQVMRLPASGKRDVRFMVVRQLKRTNRQYATSYMANGSFQNAAVWEGVDLPKVAVDRSILMLPYTYLGYGRQEGRIVNSGMDLKTRLTEEIPLVFSVNPDFRNIEGDILSLDFSRFERLANETRPFFQEGGQYFNSALFASQRIPGFDAGLNVHGKLTDALSFGVLNTSVIHDASNMVANLSYDPTPVDSFRITTTNRLKDGENNDAYLARYFRTLGPFGVFLRTMGTKDASVGKGVFNTASVFYNQGALGFFASYDNANSRFFPRLGFAPETDFAGWTYGGQWQAPVKWGSVVEAGVAFQGVEYTRFAGGDYRSQAYPTANLVFKNGTALNLGADWETFLGSKDHFCQINVVHPRGNPYNQVSLDYQVGEFSGTDYRSLAFRGAARINQVLQLTGSAQIAHFGARSEQYIVGMNYDLGKDRSISGRAVKRGGDWNAYVALRQSGNKGMEYFLILGDPNAKTFQRSLILKVAIPFKVG